MSKAVAVIPIAQLLILLSGIIIGCHFLNFIRGEAEILAITIFQDRVNLQIIQTAEDAFFCNAKNPCQKTKTQMIVVF